MKPQEYTNLDRVERVHWYYAGKRDIVRHWIEKVRPLRSEDTLLDFGAGTGLFASEFMDTCRVRCFDSYPESVKILRERLPADAVVDGSGSQVALPDSSVDCVTALDVLEHIENDQAAVTELHRLLRAGGMAVVTVPADMKLWSDWDVSLLHFRRYEAQGLAALFPSEKWKLVRVTHHNTLAYPAVYLLRKWRKWRQNRTEGGSRAEDRVPPPWLNRILKFLYSAPAKSTWFPAPFGVSLLLVAIKR